MKNQEFYYQLQILNGIQAVSPVIHILQKMHDLINSKN